MSARLQCELRDSPAEWRWKPQDQPLCDGHAAKRDLDELEEIGS